MPARALAGMQVFDDEALAAAKLRIGASTVPGVAYRELYDAYAAVAGKADPRAGVLEPVMTAHLESTPELGGPVIERR